MSNLKRSLSIGLGADTVSQTDVQTQPPCKALSFHFVKKAYRAGNFLQAPAKFGMRIRCNGRPELCDRALSILYRTVGLDIVHRLGCI
jgi:hypothetical protein